MKKILLLVLTLGLFFTACKKDEIATDDTPIVAAPTDKTLLSGTFESNSHPTTGNAKIIENVEKKKFLVLENLKSDAGPDLRIYLATDKTATSFVEITAKVSNGNSKIELPATANTDKQKFILIWCKQFSVLFGSAALK